ncbi:hypothetical protein RB195_013252 [Necator americanus]|uniref:Secreted protein n=1 Tax=Necator americanus TaxID=51031 RepID=A0ABR1DUL2_NECAM
MWMRPQSTRWTSLRGRPVLFLPVVALLGDEEETPVLVDSAVEKVTEVSVANVEVPLDVALVIVGCAVEEVTEVVVEFGIAEAVDAPSVDEEDKLAEAVEVPIP